jgi:hypothetical protein
MDSWFDGGITSVLNVAVLGAVAYGAVQILWPGKSAEARQREELIAIMKKVNELPQREFTLEVLLHLS